MSGLRSAVLFKKSYSFLVALSLCCCVQAFASSRKWGPLWLASGGLSLHWHSLWRICSKSTGFTGWGMWAQQFWGKNSLRCCVASSPTRDRTHAPCIAWQVLIHCTTRGVLPYGFMLHTFCIFRSLTIWSISFASSVLFKHIFWYLKEFIFLF